MDVLFNYANLGLFHCLDKNDLICSGFGFDRLFYHVVSHSFSPKLVRILDPNSNPIDVWVDEFSFWLANYFCEQEAQKESDQQVNEICPSEYYFSGLFRHPFL